MNSLNVWQDKNLTETLQANKVVVMPTDTLYGIVARAESNEAVARIYQIKKRDPEKKLITLVSDWADTKNFGIDSSKFKIPQYSVPTTFVLAGKAFRLPKNEALRRLLKTTGPLVAPSANPEGLTPARSIKEAKEYFGGSVDMYVDGGDIVGTPSQIISLQESGEVNIIRQ